MKILLKKSSVECNRLTIGREYDVIAHTKGTALINDDKNQRILVFLTPGTPCEYSGVLDSWEVTDDSAAPEI